MTWRKVALRIRPMKAEEVGSTEHVLAVEGHEVSVLPSDTTSTATTTSASSTSSNATPPRFFFDQVFDSSVNPMAAGYASQKTVFHRIGVQILANAWSGFNSSIFA